LGLLLVSISLSARADLLEDAARALALSLDRQTMANVLLPWRSAQPGNSNTTATPATQPLTASPGAKP